MVNHVSGAGGSWAEQRSPQPAGFIPVAASEGVQFFVIFLVKVKKSCKIDMNAWGRRLTDFIGYFPETK
jgi:hypothetical protein